MISVSKTDNKVQEHKKMGLATIDHVAKLACVSRATVARVFSRPSLVAKETSEKILDAAKRLNYKPNPLARGLAGGKTGTIGVLWSFGGPSTTVDFIRDFVTQIQKHGYIASISENASDPQITKSLIDSYSSRGLDGLVIEVSSDIFLLIKEYLDTIKFKAVLLVSDAYQDTNYDLVVLDRLGAYRDSAKHFAESGRKHIGLIITHPGSNAKINAFTNEIHKQGLVFSPENIVSLHSQLSRFESVSDNIHIILDEKFADKPFPFDALMCSNDNIAMATMSWLRKKGLGIPDDVAIIGFDNQNGSKFTYPPLASCDRRMPEMSEMMRKMLFERIENPNLSPQIVKIPMRFMWRESAGQKKNN